jgi:hypothetical protein
MVPDTLAAPHGSRAANAMPHDARSVYRQNLPTLESMSLRC